MSAPLINPQLVGTNNNTGTPLAIEQLIASKGWTILELGRDDDWPGWKQKNTGELYASFYQDFDAANFPEYEPLAELRHTNGTFGVLFQDTEGTYYVVTKNKPFPKPLMAGIGVIALLLLATIWGKK